MNNVTLFIVWNQVLPLINLDSIHLLNHYSISHIQPVIRENKKHLKVQSIEDAGNVIKNKIQCLKNTMRIHRCSGSLIHQQRKRKKCN